MIARYNSHLTTICYGVGGLSVTVLCVFFFVYLVFLCELLFHLFCSLVLFIYLKLSVNICRK